MVYFLLSILCRIDSGCLGNAVKMISRVEDEKKSFCIEWETRLNDA